MGKTVQRGLRLSKRSPIHLFDDAESAKNLRSVEHITRSLCRAGADRKSLIVAVGGGVVGDVAGFAAAAYLRGVKLVHIPTTLVAQVDSSIGGKTGVNLPEGKNLVGSFYPPQLVLTDPELLRTLSDREFRGGLAEVIKHAIIADAEMFTMLEKDMERVLRRDRHALALLIPRNVQIKARVVSRDERESGLREILNYGHTFAHALEGVTNYRRYQHGEAVAWGMIAAAFLGHELGLTRADDVSRIVPHWRSALVRHRSTARRGARYSLYAPPHHREQQAFTRPPWLRPVPRSREPVPKASLPKPMLPKKCARCSRRSRRATICSTIFCRCN